MSVVVDESACRRMAMLTFLDGLSEREKLVALEHLAKDVGISARLPNFAKVVVEMHRARFKRELLDLPDRGHHSLELSLLARRKGCRLERTGGSGDHCRIIYPQHHSERGDGLRRLSREGLTRRQALELLRSLPDRRPVNSPPVGGPAARSRG